MPSPLTLGPSTDPLGEFHDGLLTLFSPAALQRPGEDLFSTLFKLLV
jgi:hypothetical protein